LSINFKEFFNIFIHSSYFQKLSNLFLNFNLSKMFGKPFGPFYYAGNKSLFLKNPSEFKAIMTNRGDHFTLEIKNHTVIWQFFELIDDHTYYQGFWSFPMNEKKRIIGFFVSNGIDFQDNIDYEINKQETTVVLVSCGQRIYIQLSNDNHLKALTQIKGASYFEKCFIFPRSSLSLLEVYFRTNGVPTINIWDCLKVYPEYRPLPIGEIKPSANFIITEGTLEVQVKTKFKGFNTLKAIASWDSVVHEFKDGGFCFRLPLERFAKMVQFFQNNKGTFFIHDESESVFGWCLQNSMDTLDKLPINCLNLFFLRKDLYF
jgi:hypothetical protein